MNVWHASGVVNGHFSVTPNLQGTSGKWSCHSSHNDHGNNNHFSHGSTGNGDSHSSNAKEDSGPDKWDKHSSVGSEHTSSGFPTPSPHQNHSSSKNETHWNSETGHSSSSV